MPLPPPLLYCGMFKVDPTSVAAPLVPVVVNDKLFCFVANLVVRLSNVVSVSSINTERSADTVPVVVIGFGDTVMPVPAEIEVRLPDPQAFLKVKETLTRIGVASKKDKTLYQSCHILHKQGRYYLVHFKEMFMLDGKSTDFSEAVS